jgi:hypothetical protein
LLMFGCFPGGGGGDPPPARIARDVPFYRDIIATAKLRIE